MDQEEDGYTYCVENSAITAVLGHMAGQGGVVQVHGGVDGQGVGAVHRVYSLGYFKMIMLAKQRW